MPSKSNPQGRQQRKRKGARFLQDGKKAFASSVATPVSRLCELGAKQTMFQDEPGGRLQKQASRQPRGYRNCNKTKNVRMREFSRQASTAEIGVNAHECLYSMFHLH